MAEHATAFRFTEARLRALSPAPRGKRLRYHDEGQTGLCLRVTDTGAKTFKLYRKVSGRPVDLTLGSWPALTVETARKVAQEQLGSIAAGVDVQASKRAIREETTLGELFADYLELHAKARKRTWAEDQRRFESGMATWRARRLSSITPGDVQGWHARLGRTNGPIAANRAHALLRKMFNFARTRGWEGGKGEGQTDLEATMQEADAEVERVRFAAFARRMPKGTDSFALVLERYRTQAKALTLNPDAARMRDLRIHDLRRTLGSWQAAAGSSLPIIGRSIGHKQVQTTAIYARLSLEPVRESVERAASAMLLHRSKPEGDAS